MTEKNKTETLGFQTEVKQLLHLVTHSLYSNKEIFLRELISNSSDATDKLRFEALSKPELFENDSDLKIWVEFDAKERTVTIRDNGIGMSREEVIVNLGTIAKSGTKDFLAALTHDQAKDSHLIGQFGVGFYSAFVVADKVVVRTRRCGLSKELGVMWESDGTGEFTISSLEKDSRGTEVIMHLKEDENEFLDYWKLRQIITKYSDHIMLPIIMKKPLAENETVAEEETVNKATALWTLPKNDIKEDEYKALYRHISHDFEDPLVWTHNRVEGKLEYTLLLYIPNKVPFDFGGHEKRYGLKLYVHRVFILDNAEQVLPNYLRFVRGIVDSKDLPLNISREILQSNRIIEQIRAGVIKRVLDMLEKMMREEPEKYAKFWQNFGKVLKEGMAEDFANREQIAKLFKFASTNADMAEQTVTLDEYCARLIEGQDKIYYIIAETFNAAKNSPHLELFRKKNIEVLLLDERIDEWWLAHYHEHAGKKFQSVAKSDVDLSKFVDSKQKEEQEKAKTAHGDFLKKMKDVLGEHVTEVRISDRLTDSPVCIVTSESDMSYNLQRILTDLGRDAPTIKPILEINPEHALIKQLENITDEKLFAEWTNLFYEQALLIAGGKLDDVATFIKRLNELMISNN